MMLFSSDQFYIVTGASSGIGEQTALLLNELGASVVAIARNKVRLEHLKQKCKYPENMYIEVKDLTSEITEISSFIKSLCKKFGKFSGMAYCAGVSCVKPLQLVDYGVMQDTFNINYFVPMLMTKSLLDRRNNKGNGTSLVFVSSLDAQICTRGQSVYSGTKAALSASVKAISKEVSGAGIRLNSVLPSMIKTQMTEDYSKLYNISEELQKDKYPWGWGEPLDVANLIVFLLSDKSKFISGQNYIIDSGGVI